MNATQKSIIHTLKRVKADKNFARVMIGTQTLDLILLAAKENNIDPSMIRVIK